MSPSIDFSQVKGLDPVPEGNYEATVVGAEAGVSQKGNPKIDIRYEIYTPEGQKRNVFDQLTFSEKSMGFVKAKLIGLGFPKDFAGEVGPEDLLGLECVISVVIDTGRTDEATGEAYPDRNRVVKVRPRTTQTAESFIK